VTSFSSKIKEKMDQHAYCLGINACNAGYPMGVSPYEGGSKLDKDWVDGYLDALFIIGEYNGN